MTAVEKLELREIELVLEAEVLLEIVVNVKDVKEETGV